MQEVYIIFDIGKTNKKYYLFDSHYKVLEHQSITFNEILDDDGYPCDDLKAITIWIQSSFEKIMTGDQYQVKGINFSSYGASLVHLSDEGEPLTPLYNYLKPLDKSLIRLFYEKFGPQPDFEKATASPGNDNLLNSGMQLFWLKKTKPEIFQKIKTSLHFPQYLSYLFTKQLHSEYSSVGCHTALWDYTTSQYHSWVNAEGLDRILPPVGATAQNTEILICNQKIKVGKGIHDSSAALVPYLHKSNKPFILLSTGTWSVCLNPFYQGNLTTEDIAAGCLNYLRTDGKTVRAGRLMMGDEHDKQVSLLNRVYNQKAGYYKTCKFDETIYSTQKEKEQNFFEFKNFNKGRIVEGSLSHLSNFEAAYTQLMIELVACQIENIQLVQGESHIDRIYIDGGFVDNDLFLSILERMMVGFEIIPSEEGYGSALGALLILN